MVVQGFKEFIDEDSEKRAITKELQNGRLAMLAMLELFRHDAQQLVGGMYTEGAMKPLITGASMCLCCVCA